MKPDSDWHGHHDWRPQGQVFLIRDFMFDGDESPPLACLTFSLHLFSAARGVWRYTGHVSNRRGTSAPLCLVVRNRQADPPEILLLLLIDEDDWVDDPTGSEADSGAETWAAEGGQVLQ